MRILIYLFGVLLMAPIALADQITIANYNTTRSKVFWKQLYPNGGSTLYCDQRFEGRSPLNIEHVYPASWMAKHLNCGTRKQCRKHPTHKVRFNHMEADLHNLYPAMGGINSARSNKTFGVNPGENHPLVFCDFEVNSGTAEPRPGARGEIARAILYMQDEYGLPLTQGYLIRYGDGIRTIRRVPRKYGGMK